MRLQAQRVRLIGHDPQDFVKLGNGLPVLASIVKVESLEPELVEEPSLRRNSCLTDKLHRRVYGQKEIQSRHFTASLDVRAAKGDYRDHLTLLVDSRATAVAMRDGSVGLKYGCALEVVLER